MAEDVPRAVPWEVLLQCSSDLLTVHDRDGRVLFANDAAQHVVGLASEELVGRTPFHLVHPEDRERVVADLRELRRHPGAVHVLTLRARHSDGDYRHLESLARNGLDDPALRGVLVSTRDVTDRAVYEQALAASEVRHRELVERAPVGLVVVDEAGVVRFANPAAHAVAGVADAGGLVVSDLVRADERQRCREQLRRAAVDRVVPAPAEYHLDAEGRETRVVTSAPLPYDWEGRPAALLVLQDVTVVRSAQQERDLALGRLDRILRTTAEGIVELDDQGRLTFLNEAAASVLGLDPAAVLGRLGHEIYHHSHADGTPYDPDQCPSLQAARLGRRADVQGEVFWHADGTPVPVEYRTTPIEGGGAVVTFHDVSERLRTRARLSRVAAFQRAVLDSLPALTAVVDRTGRIVAVNQAWKRHMQERGGRPETCGVGVDFLAVCESTQGRDRPEALVVARGLRALLAGQAGEFQRDVPCLAPGGEHIHFSLQMVPLSTPEGGVVIGYTDITSRKRLEVESAHRATHDVLTGLPNRTLLLERLEHALEHRPPGAVALLFLDLDSFKLVNDGYGHEAGDVVLRHLADRLRHNVRPEDTVARLAGDEFVVLCEDLPHVTEAHLLADRLLAAVADPFPLGDATITLGVSIGIAVATRAGVGAAELLRSADHAMFEAKARGRNRFAVHDAGVRGRNAERLDHAMALRRLVDDDQLLVHYQPVVDLRDGRMTGAEALLRWYGDDALPDTLTAIALAEEIGLIQRIGDYVLAEATGQAASFRTAGGVALPLAVNLAPQQLVPSLVEQVERVAQEAGYPLGSLTLELTERSLVTERAASIDVLRALRARGVRIALDDFGVGYSSLAYLRDLPLDVIKVDATFVRSLGGPHPDDRLVRAIISMARALDLDVVAEGVEQRDQQERLVELGVERGQGFLFSRARPHPEVRARALE